MRLKLFETFENDKELLRHVKEYFGDMIDEDECDLDVDEDEIYLYFEIETNYQNPSFEDFFNYKKKEFEKISLIHVTIERLHKSYDGDFDVNLESEVDTNSFTIILRITPGTAKEGEFYKITKHGVKFNNGKLISILKLPKSTEVSLSYGTNHHLSFQFNDEQDLERYKDRLIEDFLKLKIDGKPLCADSKFGWSSSTGDEMLKYKIHKNYKRDYHGRRGAGSETINSVEFGLNSEFDYSW